MFTRDDLFIGGRWEKPTSEERVTVVSPTTEEVIGSVPAPAPADVDRAIAAARKALDEGPWPRMSIHERAAHLRTLASELTARQSVAVELQIDEMGGTRAFVEASTVSIPSVLDQAVKDAADVDLSEVRDGVVGK